MSEDMLIGILIGGVFMGIMWAINRYYYGQMLLQCADKEMAEKLDDGHWYVIVPESRFNAMKAASRINPSSKGIRC